MIDILNARLCTAGSNITAFPQLAFRKPLTLAVDTFVILCHFITSKLCYLMKCQIHVLDEDESICHFI
jgi:hypothetical protein